MKQKLVVHSSEKAVEREGANDSDITSDNDSQQVYMYILQCYSLHSAVMILVDAHIL